MAVERAFINLTLAIDLDMVPGAYHVVEDWMNFATYQLCTASNYKPEVAIHSAEVRRYTWDDAHGWLAPEPPKAAG